MDVAHLKGRRAEAPAEEGDGDDMQAAKWITLWTCSLDGDVVIECRARRNPTDDPVTVRMPSVS